MPTSAGRLYSRRFAVSSLGDVTVKAIAVRDNYFDSPVATFTFKRLPYSASECLNVGFGEALTGGDVDWFRVLGDAAHDGEAALRSGAVGEGEATSVEMTVYGEGMLSFWLKTSSHIVRGRKLDYLSFTVDGAEQMWLGGSNEWTNVVCNITGSGAHTLAWTFTNNTDSITYGENCAWLDEVVWLPSGELPELGENASAELISQVLGTSADAKLAENITTAADYAKYRAWALGLSGVTAEEVKASPNAWLSYALDVDSLIEGEIADGDLRIEAFASGGGDGIFGMKVRVGDADVGEGVTAANMARALVVEGTPSLAEDFSVEKVAVEFGAPDDGAAMFSVTPRESGGSFFFRTRLRNPANGDRGNGCEVSFDLNGGGSLPEGMSAKRFVEYAAAYGELPVPEREGYEFVGWFTSPEGGEQVSASAEMSILASQTLYARWEEKKDDDRVQLWEGGPYWATTNIGAEEPEDYGYYFWWGDTVGYKRENDKWVASDGSNSNFSFVSGNAPTSRKDNSTLQSEGWITSDGVLASAHDAAHVHWGGDWRIPTKAELDALNSNCDWTWATTNGVNGYIVRGKGDYASNSIFLPCSGTGDSTSLLHSGSEGGIWSSLPNPSYLSGAASWYQFFNSSGPEENGYRNRWNGQSVRPVSEGAK